MKASKIGLGTVQFGLDYGISNQNGKTEKISEILEFSKDSGIDTIDTASAYGDAEKILGKYDLSTFKIVSKFTPSKSRAELHDQFIKTSNDLNQKSLYGYLAHTPLNLLSNDWEWNFLMQLKSEFLVSKIGYSLNHPDELKSLLSNGLVPDIVQIPFNYFDRRFEIYFSELKDMNIEIHCRSIFLQGLFFVNPDSLPDYFNEIKHSLKIFQKIDDFPKHLLNFVSDNPKVDRIIIGVESLAQLRKNVEFYKSSKSGKELPVIPTFDDSILMPMNWPKTR